MRQKIFALIVLSALATAITHAENRRVTTLRISKPITEHPVLMTDSVDVWGKAWDKDNVLNEQYADITSWRTAPITNDSVLVSGKSKQIIVAGFTIQNQNYTKATVSVQGAKACKIYIDGKEGAEGKLVPGRHEVALRITQEANHTDTLKVSLDAPESVVINPTGGKPYSLDRLMYGERMGGVSMSADGRFITLDKYITNTEGRNDWTKYLIDLQTGQRTIVANFRQWTSKGHQYISERRLADKTVEVFSVDALTGKRELLCVNRTGESGNVLSGEKYMYVNLRATGPKDNALVHQILEPDDRQPGWRDRSNVGLIDITTGQLRRLTQGTRSNWGVMSPSNTQMLIFINENDITQRPFSFSTALLLNLETMQADTLFTHEGFCSAGQWMPDEKSIIFMGGAEAFGGIGNRLPEGIIPNMFDYDLFRMDLATRNITPLTADFNPSIKDWQISKADGKIYALTENRDNQDIFRIDPLTGKAEMLKLSERFVLRFDVSEQKPQLVYYGQGHSNSDRLYVVDLKSGKEKLIEDLSAERMKDIELGEFGEWNFQADRGDTIYGRYYLPPHFDESKQYPMLVYYYGGCSPTGRYLDSYYNYHHWASMGYVVYVIQPSGASGFGQEFAARHVNAYGDYTAQDIIQGTKQFCKEHPYVNTKKIGCLGASYGGFMTQYLQTQTDIFAAAMSHAGISDPSSYWGYGYWGYSYSAVSAANSYPWNNPTLFNEHAPLQLADRIHTPILFMHGSADTNVPINESIQMFTALKILGRETAFVTVEGENHHILDYPKRLLWQNTIYAWFERWLKDDPTWWNEMYPKKNL